MGVNEGGEAQQMRGGRGSGQEIIARDSGTATIAKRGETTTAREKWSQQEACLHACRNSTLNITLSVSVLHRSVTTLKELTSPLPPAFQGRWCAQGIIK